MRLISQIKGIHSLYRTDSSPKEHSPAPGNNHFSHGVDIAVHNIIGLDITHRIDIRRLKEAPGNLSPRINKTIVLGAAPLFDHDISAGNQSRRLHIVFNDNIAGHLDISARIHAADHIYGAVHLQLARGGGHILPYHQHIADDDLIIDIFKFTVHLGNIRHAVIQNGEALPPDGFQIVSVLRMYNFPVNIFPVRALSRRMIDGNPLILFDHLKGFYIDIVNSAVRKRRRNPGKIKPDKKLKPAVLAFRSRNPFRNQNPFVGSFLVDEIGDRIRLNSKDDISSLQLIVDIFLRNQIRHDFRYIGIGSVSVVFYGNVELTFHPHAKKRILSAMNGCLSLFVVYQGKTLLLHVRSGINQAVIQGYVQAALQSQANLPHLQMTEKDIGIDGYVKLLFQAEADLLHLHPVIFGIRIAGNIQLLAQAYADLIDLRRTHFILQPFVNRQPVQQCGTYLLQ